MRSRGVSLTRCSARTSTHTCAAPTGGPTRFASFVGPNKAATDSPMSSNPNTPPPSLRRSATRQDSATHERPGKRRRPSCATIRPLILKNTPL